MRRWICFLLALSVALFGAAAALAEAPVPEAPVTGTADGFTWKALEDGTAEITGYTGPETGIAVPAEVDGLPVSRIGAWAFEKSAVTRIEIPEGVTSVGRYCFSECRDLAEIVLPESLTSLGDCAFILCTSLTALTLPEALTEVGQNPFCYCTALTELEGLEANPALLFTDNALYDRENRRLIGRLCAAEERIFEVWDECEVIGDYALTDNKHLASAVLPESVTVVGSYAFFHCTGLQTVEFPGTVEAIGDGCFEQCIAVRMIAPEDSFAWKWAEARGMGILAPDTEEPAETGNPDSPLESEDAG